MRIIGNDPSTPRQAQIVASGTLSTGDTVAVNADGTVSAVAGSSTSGNTVVFSSGVTDLNDQCHGQITYDTSNDKIVVSYQDDSNSGYGTAVVGTVSGSSISFGTPVVYHSVNSDNFSNCTFDSVNNKIVIAYRNGSNSDYGTAVVGTVSGTSITFGTPVVFRSANTQAGGPTFDSNAGKVVIQYYDGGSGGAGAAIVGTVSGTSITFGSATQYTSNVIQFNNSVFDPDTNKTVISYSDASDGYKGKCVIGTVSGTSISFGTPVIYNNASTRESSIDYNTTENKVIIAYRDDGDADKGKAIAGTVSGTSISFGSEYEYFSGNSESNSITHNPSTNETLILFNDGAVDNGKAVIGSLSGTVFSFGSVETWSSSRPFDLGSVYDPDQQKVVSAYTDLGNSNFGTAAIVEVGSTNLTAENYIGTAASGAPDGTGAKINLKGAVDENQSGLTAGQSYYVQTDGTLGTTPADPSVFAGTAVAANKLIVKG